MLTFWWIWRELRWGEAGACDAKSTFTGGRQHASSHVTLEGVCKDGNLRAEKIIQPFWYVSLQGLYGGHQAKKNHREIQRR